MSRLTRTISVPLLVAATTGAISAGCIAPASAATSSKPNMQASPSTPGSSGYEDMGPESGAYYPLYNKGANQYMDPTPAMHFNDLNTLDLAFGEPRVDNGHVTFGLPDDTEMARMQKVVQLARSQNPDIKILITLGWGKGEMPTIESQPDGEQQFANSVVAFVDSNHLDGFDIDAESEGGKYGDPVTQDEFDSIVGTIHETFGATGRHLYLTTTPSSNNGIGFENSTIDAKNIQDFDRIQIQTYGSKQALMSDLIAQTKLWGINYPATKIANGADIESGPYVPPVNTGGSFIWNISSDSVDNFKTVLGLGEQIHYHPDQFSADLTIPDGQQPFFDPPASNQGGTTIHLALNGYFNDLYSTRRDAKVTFQLPAGTTIRPSFTPPSGWTYSVTSDDTVTLIGPAYKPGTTTESTLDIPVATTVIGTFQIAATAYQQPPAGMWMQGGTRQADYYVRPGRP